MRKGGPYFYCGVYLLCLSTLVLQIVQTRILSVVSFYHLAFFAISMAMFGMTAGALHVYRSRATYTRENLERHLARYSLWYALSIAICAGLQMASVAAYMQGAVVLFIWAKMIILLAVPFFFAGMAVALALTCSNRPVGIIYGVDLAGAASGCLISIVLLNLIDGPSALFAVAAIAVVASACFAGAARAATPEAPALRGGASMAATFRIASILGAMAVLNASTPDGIQPIIVKGERDARERFDFEQWNSFSRIVAYKAVTKPPYLWGPSPVMPSRFEIDQHEMTIDGSAGTWMPRFDGNPASLDFLDYDLTTLAYNIRHQGRAAVIGVGGGRDMLSAYHFGFRDITGVELNPIFVDLLVNPARYRSFSGLADLPGVRFFIDDARSWFTRSSESFDLIQMSLVDTWAATGAGGFTLSENGLYTVEGWQTFLRHLSPGGIFTVSRWYAPDNEDEAGRAVSVAIAALYGLGVEHPQAHMFMAGQRRLSTLIVSRSPLSADDIARLRAAAERYQYKVILSPDAAPSTPVFRDLLGARSVAELESRAAGYTLDLSPATDARPFFFNMLRIDPAHMWEAYKLRRSGAVFGNLMASSTVLLIILLSAIFVVFVIIMPVRDAVQGVDRRLAFAGTAYFLLIGLGFMLVEIGIIQRISVFLGYPVYALAIGLFSLILATGIGSFASERLVLGSAARLVAWALLLSIYLAGWPAWFPLLAAKFEAADIVLRGLVCILAILPAGVLMGFGFPTGMRLTTAVDPRATPWFWGVNGAAGVLGAGLAVGCSITTSIDMTLRLGAAAYLLLALAGLSLRRTQTSAAALAPEVAAAE
jgi:spermidine synthase